MNRRTHRFLLGSILAIYLLLAGIYSIVNPIFEAPDEHQHTFFILHILDERSLPVLDAESGRPWHEEGFPPQPYRAVWSQEGGQPPLYYLLGAVVAAPFYEGDAAAALHLNPHANLGDPRLPGNKNRMIHTDAESWPWHGLPLTVHVLRFYSLCLGLATLLVGYRLLRILLPRQPDLALAALALTAFNPQFIFISSAVSNDNMIMLLATVVLYHVTRILLAPPAAFSVRQAFVLGVGLGLALLAKLSGLGLLVLVMGMVGLWGLWQRQAALIGRRLLLVLAVVLALAGWWFVRNQVLYGDATALQPFVQIVGSRQRALDWDHLSTELQGLAISSLAVFGWFNILLPDVVYRLWGGFIAGAGLGWVLVGIRRWRQGWRPRLQHRRQWVWLLLAAWLAVLFASLLRWISLTPGAQGRLIFPGVIALHLFLLYGWQAWLPGRRPWLALPVLAFCALAALSPITVIRPAYQPPPTISPAQIPAEARLDDPLIIDDRMQLLGLRIEPTTLRRGDDYTVTLYWQATAPVSYDASVFVHLLGPGMLSFGGIDTYPGWGTAPTSQWQPGVVLVDRYKSYIPWEVVAPTLLKVDAGMFDYVSRQAYPRRLQSGQPVPPALATLRIVPRRQQNPDFEQAVNQRFGEAITLLGVDVPPDPWQAGDTVSLSLVWQTDARLALDYQLFLQLLDADGQRAAGQDEPVGGVWWPSSAWEPGQPSSQTIDFSLPADLAPGEYTLIVGLYRLDTLARLPAAGPLVRDNARVLGPVTIVKP